MVSVAALLPADAGAGFGSRGTLVVGSAGKGAYPGTRCQAHPRGHPPDPGPASHPQTGRRQDPGRSEDPAAGAGSGRGGSSQRARAVAVAAATAAASTAYPGPPPPPGDSAGNGRPALAGAARAS